MGTRSEIFRLKVWQGFSESWLLTWQNNTGYSPVPVFLVYCRTFITSSACNREMFKADLKRCWWMKSYELKHSVATISNLQPWSGRRILFNGNTTMLGKYFLLSTEAMIQTVALLHLFWLSSCERHWRSQMNYDHVSQWQTFNTVLATLIRVLLESCTYEWHHLHASWNW